jgi:hypothetical protein
MIVEFMLVCFTGFAMGYGLMWLIFCVILGRGR